MEFPWNKPQHDKIFISYRRDDTAGHAGRLSDSLSDYFGHDRVYMDVKDIEYAQDYKDAIEESLSVTGALLVVIGDQWCSISDDSGKRRLDDPNDDVSREIKVALDSGRTVLPVLIGDAVMPGPDELPEQLTDLSRRNAISVSDERWHFDVDRLAKVLSIDLPSSAQRKLDFLRLAASLLLIVACTITAIVFAKEVFAMLSAHGTHSWLSTGPSTVEPVFDSLVASLPFAAILGAATMVGFAAPLMEKSKLAWATMYGSYVSTALAFIYFLMFNNEARPQSLTVTFVSGMLIALAMLVLMNLAGFKAK